ncbi:MAG: aminotransferase class I/II-fold pyridoxal phosphate-dependent enzyme [Bacillota bacterium]
MRIEPFAIERWFAKYEFLAKYNLAESCVQSFTVAELLDLTRTSMAEVLAHPLGYSESNGCAELRELIAGLYPGATAANVLVTVGAIEANFLALSALVKPGGQVVSEFPAYQQLYSIPEALGADVSRWELREDEGYYPNVDRLRSLLTVDPELVIINHPHNPTGKRISAQTLAEIGKVVDDAGAILYSDEVYRGLTLHDDLPSPSAWSTNGRRVVVGSMSKAYGLSGLRIGWIVADEDLIERCWCLRDYTSICPPQLSEKLAILALQNRELVLTRNRAIARLNLSLVNDWLRSLDGLITWHEPEEGVIGFPRLHFADDSQLFCEHLMKEMGVLFVPGKCFDEPRHIRLGFGYGTQKLEQGLELVSHYLKRFQ